MLVGLCHFDIKSYKFQNNFKKFKILGLLGSPNFEKYPPDNLATLVHEAVRSCQDMPGPYDGAPTPALLPYLYVCLPGILVRPRLLPTNNPFHPARASPHQLTALESQDQQQNIPHGTAGTCY